MAKYYPDIAKGAKGTRALFLVHARLCARRESAISLSLSLSFFFFERRRRSFRLTLLLSLITKKTQIYSPAPCRTKTNSPWTRSQSPAGCVSFSFRSVLFFVFCQEREKDLEREMDSSSSLFFQNKMLALERKERVSRFPLSLSLLCFSKKKTLTFTRAALSFKKKTVRLCDD